MEGVHLAREQMERLMACRYADPVLAAGAHTTDVPGVAYGVAVVAHAQYTVKNIAVTGRWVNPGQRMTSTVVLAGSSSAELHP